MSGAGLDPFLVKGGQLSLRAADLRYDANARGGMFFPEVAAGGVGAAPTLTAWSAANRGQAARCIIPRTGTLVSLAYYLGVGNAGTYDMAVWDTGDASAGNRTRLAALGSTAVPNLPASWVEWNPNLAVRAGQHVDVELCFSDVATVTVAKIAASNTNELWLPANYLACVGGAPAKLGWQVAAHMPIPAGPLAEATCVTTNYAPFFMGRVA